MNASKIWVLVRRDGPKERRRAGLEFDRDVPREVAVDRDASDTAIADRVRCGEDVVNAAGLDAILADDRLVATDTPPPPPVVPPPVDMLYRELEPAQPTWLLEFAEDLGLAVAVTLAVTIEMIAGRLAELAVTQKSRLVVALLRRMRALVERTSSLTDEHRRVRWALADFAAFSRRDGGSFGEEPTPASLGRLRPRVSWAMNERTPHVLDAIGDLFGVRRQAGWIDPMFKERRKAGELEVVAEMAVTSLIGDRDAALAEHEAVIAHGKNLDAISNADFQQWGKRCDLRRRTIIASIEDAHTRAPDSLVRFALLELARLGRELPLVRDLEPEDCLAAVRGRVSFRPVPVVELDEPLVKLAVATARGIKERRRAGHVFTQRHQILEVDQATADVLSRDDGLMVIEMQSAPMSAEDRELATELATEAADLRAQIDAVTAERDKYREQALAQMATKALKSNPPSDGKRRRNTGEVY